MTMLPSRSRLVAAGALALALGGSIVPSVAWAQDAPEAPVLSLFQTIVEKRFDDIGQHFCPEFADEAAELDLGAALANTLPEGLDPQVAVDALVFAVTGPGGSGEPVVTVVSEDATGTRLDVQATLNAALDPENSEPFIRAIVEAQLVSSGMEVSEENIAAFMTLVEGQLEGMEMFSQSISTAITVTQAEDGTWQICSSLAPTASPGASTAPRATGSPDSPVAPADVSSSIPGSGIFLVGADIQPGTYRTAGPDGASMCYWARLSGLSGELDDIIANANIQGQGVVTISPSDAAFESSGCQSWLAVG